MSKINLLYKWKKINGKKLIRPGDQFQVGDTLIIFTGHDFTRILRSSELDTEQSFFYEDSEYDELIKNIEKELLFIEYYYKEKS